MNNRKPFDIYFTEPLDFNILIKGIGKILNVSNSKIIPLKSISSKRDNVLYSFQKMGGDFSFRLELFIPEEISTTFRNDELILGKLFNQELGQPIIVPSNSLLTSEWILIMSDKELYLVCEINDDDKSIKLDMNSKKKYSQND
jgi:hypothetical protein